MNLAVMAAGFVLGFGLHRTWLYWQGHPSHYMPSNKEAEAKE